MKTVLFVNASGARYFRRENGVWLKIDKPERNDKLWVIANQSEETLETFQLPLLFGSDRRNFIEHRLLAAFPHSQYRAAPILTGKLFQPSAAVLTGLNSAEAITSKLEKLDIPVAGVWGLALLLTLMLKRLSISDVVLALPSAHYLRLLVIKQGMPVLTRCVHRYSEDNNQDNDNDANEILRTRQHLENHRVFEHDTIPPILYLGDASSLSSHLSQAGMTLLPTPAQLFPKGDADYLHALFEYVTSSPRGQLAPLLLRARHLTERIRQTAYLGIAASLLAVILLGQEDFRALIRLHWRAQTLNTALQQASGEREQLTTRISASGIDPALLRQATRFAALEMDPAPSPEAILQFTAKVIADLPQVRIKNLMFRFPAPGDRYCQGHSVIDLPLLNQKIDLSQLSGSKPADSDSDAEIPQRYTELQFSILLTDNLAPTAQIEIHKRISAAIKTDKTVQLMQDPAAFSLINTLKGGIGMEATPTENLWCMSIPWRTTAAKEQP